MKPAYAAPLRAADSWHATRRGDSLVITAVKRITADDPYLGAHFPCRPVYPGVFLLETVRQVVLAALADDRPAVFPDVSAVRSLRFRHPLVPGDVLRAGIRVSGPDDDGAWLVRSSCRRADGTPVAQLTLELGPAPTGQAADGRPGRLAADHVQAQIDGARIRSILPHGQEMVLVDRAELVESGRRLRAFKTISTSEPCYQRLDTHYLAYPISLIIESFGQAAAVLWLLDAGQLGESTLMFAAARDCRFEGQAYPGDVLRHEVTLERSIAGTGFATGEIWAADHRIATMGSLIAVVRDALPTAREQEAPR